MLDRICAQIAHKMLVLDHKHHSKFANVILLPSCGKWHVSWVTS